MGIHGSPTCTLVFGQNDNCTGYLLGEEGHGMKLMFHMMNAARIEVGLQGAAAAGATQQQATAYAHERLQSRSWKEMRNPEAPQVPIVEHPDVRRMLLTSKAYVEAMRAILLQTSYYLDMAHLSEGEEAEKYQSYVELLTPICKAWCSEWAVQVTHMCLQVYGGYGYTCEYPAEQYMRDSVIACIYEGTNGIQALDFVARKLPMKGGKPIREILGAAEKTFNTAKSDKELMEPAWMLAAALKQIETISKELTKRPDAIQMVLLNAPMLLDMVGTVVGAHLLLDQAMMAKGKLASHPRGAGRRHRRQEGLQDLPPGSRRGGLLSQQGPDRDPLLLPCAAHRGRKGSRDPVRRAGAVLRDHVTIRRTNRGGGCFAPANPSQITNPRLTAGVVRESGVGGRGSGR